LIFHKKTVKNSESSVLDGDALFEGGDGVLRGEDSAGGSGLPGLRMVGNAYCGINTEGGGKAFLRANMLRGVIL
jgi:hypothetical protein